MGARGGTGAAIDLALRWLLVLFYGAAGVLHLTATAAFARIVPPILPDPRLIVTATGLCELAGALGVVLGPTRRLAARLLALYALCVWPANIYQAFWRVSVPPIPDSWWYHGPRLALQPVLIWWALRVAGGTRDRRDAPDRTRTAPWERAALGTGEPD